MEKKFLMVSFVVFAGFLFCRGIEAQETCNTSFSRGAFLSGYVSRTWTWEDGLPGNSVTDIIQASSGYIYLGTYDGLVRFDGVEFETYNRSSGGKYPFVSARVVFEDSSGNIWSGSNDEGVFKITAEGEVVRFSEKEGLPNNSVRAVEEDREGRIWIGTAGGVAFIKGGKVFRPLGLEKFGDGNILVSEIFCDSMGKVWILSPKADSVYIYSDGDFEKFPGFKNFKNPVVNFVMQDKNSGFWFGVAPHYAVKISGGKESVLDVGHGSRPGSGIMCIYQDKNGGMWFALDTGIAVSNGGSLSYFDENNGLSDEKVVKIMQDREENIWLATARGGIERLSQSKFKTTSMGTTINAVAEDTFRGCFWLAGDNGLYCLSKSGFTENSLSKFCSDVRVRDVFCAEDGTVLVSCYEKLGEVVMSPDGKISSITQAAGLAGNKVRVGIKARNGDIYAGTTTGLSVISAEDGGITNITKKDGIPNEYIMCVYEDSNGEIWAGTDGGGIFMLKDGALCRKLSVSDGLAGSIIFKITENSPGDYWITTGTGISRLDAAAGGKIVSYGSSDGLAADGIFQVIPGQDGALWMTSNTGIFCAAIGDFDRVKSGKAARISTKSFGRSDGLVSAGVTSTSKSIKDSRGRLWFTLIDGFSIYDPVNAAKNKVPPLVSIEKIIVDNEELTLRGGNVLLEPGAKRIEIKYTGLCFVSSEQTQFSSRLEGFEDGYSPWSLKRSVSYTNLRPGSYKFSVLAANSDGVQSERAEEMIVIKKPYFWEAAWFWLFSAIIAAGAFFSIVRYRFSQMKKYQLVLEKAVQDRTKELYDQERESENLILNILPKDIAAELKRNPKQKIAKTYKNAAVLFADIVGFTKMADSMSAADVVSILNDLVSRFDERAIREGVEKIKTMGDAYMAATGLSENPDSGDILKMMRFAHGILDDLAEFNRGSKVKIQLRIGVNCGKIVAGIIGKSKFIYDIWGDTVNVAFRMQVNGEAGKICVTEDVYNAANGGFKFSGPFEIDVKGKGKMKAYFAEPR